MAVLLLVCGFAAWGRLAKASYVELYSYRLSQSDAAEVSHKLAELGVSFQISPEGQVLVLPRDRERARSQLAFYHLPGHPGMAAGQGWTADLTLHGELVQLLRQRPHIDDAWVMVVPEGEENAVEVLLRFEAGARIGQQEVQEIVRLVVGKVPQARPEDVRITDTEGRSLTTRRMVR